MLAWRATDRPRPGASSGLGGIMTRVAWLLLTISPFTFAYDLDPDDKDGVKDIAKDMVEDMMSFYDGNKPGGIPGDMRPPYYWWQAGAMMGTLVDYWYYTGDDHWNDVASEGLQFQSGDESDYMPRNQTRVEGNDDQGFWGISAMNAAELKFPDPPGDKPQWLALAQGVFNTQAARWDTEHCGGGLRWQIFSWNDGYDYKNTISAACFFALGSRLALYTGNGSYAKWAEKTWDWTESVGYIDEDHNIYDGAHITDNCSSLTKTQWSYNVGAYLMGAAAMYNHTEDDKWKNRVDGMIDGLSYFFKGGDKDIMVEPACEPDLMCNKDQEMFKGFLSRWMASTVKWYPETSDKIMPLLRSTSVAAAKQCKGGDNKRMCGLTWTDDGKWDGTSGPGQQLAVAEATLANLIHGAKSPVTDSTGGTSKGDPGAGGTDIGRVVSHQYAPVTTGDRAGAGILTAVVLGLLIAGVCFMLSDDVKDAAATGGISGALGYYPAAGRIRPRTMDMGNVFPLEKTGSVRSRIEKTGSVHGSGMVLARGSNIPPSPRAAPATPQLSAASPRRAPPTPREVPATPGQWLDAAAAADNAGSIGRASPGPIGRASPGPIGRASPGPVSPGISVAGPSTPRTVSPGINVAGPSTPAPLSPGSNVARPVSPNPNNDVLQAPLPPMPKVAPAPPAGAWLDLPSGAAGGEGRISWPGHTGSEEVWEPSNRQRVADH